MYIYMTGNYEISDYKGRTPLYLAAELDRTVAAEYLLSLDPPADCQAIDKRGNHVIGSMIRTMPDVVSIALIQFYRHIIILDALRHAGSASTGPVA